MKVLFDHQIFSMQNAGGASRYFYELALHLQQIEGIHVRVAAGLNASVYDFGRLNGAWSRQLRAGWSTRPGKLRYCLNEFASVSEYLFSRYDIYHPTLYRAMPWVRRRKVVVTHHDCTHELFPHLFRNSEIVIANKRRLYFAADAIICVSESSRQDLLRFYPVDGQRVSVIHHGLRRFAQPDGVETSPPLRTKPFVLFVGARGSYKNFLVLLEAYADSGLSSQFDLVAIGGGELSELEARTIQSLHIAAKVLLIPSAGDDVVARAYREAALFVYPSLYEGFGFPPLEAMSVGCPVLTSNTSSMPEICGPAAMYFDPAVPGDLVSALQGALGQARDLSRLQAGYRQAARFDWVRTAAKTLNVYRTTLKG